MGRSHKNTIDKKSPRKVTRVKKQRSLREYYKEVINTSRNPMSITQSLEGNVKQNEGKKKVKRKPH